MRTTVLSFLASAALAAFAAFAPAQAPSVPVDGGRRLVLLDARELLAEAAPGPGLRLKVDGAERPTPDPLVGVAAFLKRFAAPALAPADDVQPLAGRYLAVLSTAEGAARVAALLRTATERRDDLLQIDARLLQLPEATYTKVVAPLFAKDSTPEQRKVMILTGSLQPFLDAVEKEGADVLQAPQVTVRPLCQASLSTGEHIPYVRDFTIERKGGTAIANPVIDEVVDGLELQLLATYYEDDKVAVDCKLESNRVRRPLSEAQVDLGVGAPVKVQLPQVATVRLAQTGILPLGGALLLSAPRADGSWLCALVSLRRHP